MVTIIAIDKEGNETGLPKKVDNATWGRLLNLKGKLRWKLIKEKNGRKKRSGIGNAVEQAK